LKGNEQSGEAESREQYKLYSGLAARAEVGGGARTKRVDFVPERPRPLGRSRAPGLPGWDRLRPLRFNDSFRVLGSPMVRSAEALPVVFSLVLLVAVSAAARSVTLSVGPAPIRNVSRWWDVSPRPANDGMELIKANSHVAKSLPRPWTSRCEKTALLTSAIAVVRLLGGWKDDEGSEKKDLAQGACDGLTNASLLYERLDAVVDACLTPIVVLDNTPWCFSNTTKKSFYGNGDAPRDMKSYSEFLDEIFEAILARYGDEAKRWYYRVGTEPNYGGHWTAGFRRGVWRTLARSSDNLAT
jgi:hypothetical protein